jgi:cell pole-organizing protein PopZ
MSGTQGPNGQDPNMEDILASIRRILNEDEPTAGAPAAPAAAAMPGTLPPRPAPVVPAPVPASAQAVGGTAPALPGSTPLTSSPAPHRAEEPEEDAPPAPGPASGPGAEPLTLTEAMMVAPEAPSGPPPVAPSPDAVPSNGSLLAPSTAAAAAAALGELARAVAAEQKSVISRNGPSIEDVVREEIRPLVKNWLDAHLPGMVERMVRAEIERVLGRPAA